MKQKSKQDLILEICLIIVIVGLSSLMLNVSGFQMTVLNLFFLPVLLGAFFLGRYRAGVLALLSFVMVTIVAAQDFRQFTAASSPVTTALAITIWGAVLGLTTIIAGTLSDERTTQITELHGSYIGVIEVLSKYLRGIGPHHQDRPLRIAELSQAIGAKLHLTAKEIDEIRVAALLQELDHLEITARVVRKGMGSYDSVQRHPGESTFNGADLVQSLGAVISGSLPLLCRCEDDLTRVEQVMADGAGSTLPLGARIIRTARDYDRLVYGQNSSVTNDPVIVLAEMKAGTHGMHDADVLRTLEQIVLRQGAEGTKLGSLAVDYAASAPTNLRPAKQTFPTVSTTTQG